MPRYTWICEECDHSFEISSYMSEAHLKPECPQCGHTRKVVRDFLSDNIHVSGGPKTLGSFADKHSDKMSEEQKHHLRNKNYESPRF